MFYACRVAVPKFAVITTTAIALAACSIYPTPIGETPDLTIPIVRKLRCEVKDALIDRVINVLAQQGETEKNNDLIARANRLEAVKLDDDLLRYELDALNLKNLGDTAYDRLDRFLNTTIGYGFEFNITELNSKTGAVGFSFPFSNGSVGLGIGATNVLTRRTSREFDLTDAFIEYKKLTCNGVKKTARGDENVQRSKRGNFAYPLTGKVGLKKAIDTFIDLNIEEVAAVNSTRVLTEPYVETLTYTTLISGSVTPSVTLNPVPNDFRLTSGSLTKLATRTDVHEVTLTIVTQPGNGRTQTLFNDSEKDARRQEVLQQSEAEVKKEQNRQRNIGVLQESLVD